MFLITIVFAKVKKRKDKKQTKIQKKKKPPRKEQSHSPDLCVQPPGGEVAPCAWASQGSCRADLWAHRALLLSPASRDGVVMVGCGSGRVASVTDTGQGVCHTPHTSGPSRGTAGPSGPGQWASEHTSVLRAGSRRFPSLVCSCLQSPRESLFSTPSRCPHKPMWQDYWTSLNGTIINPCSLSSLRGRERASGQHCRWVSGAGKGASLF